MTLTTRRFFPMAALLALLGVAACGDDDGGGGPSGLAAPTGVTATQLSVTSIRISWTAATGATGYLVQRADASNPSAFTQIGGGIVSGTSVDDNDATEGVAYSYRVASASASDTSDFSTPITFTTGAKEAILTGPVTASRTLFADTVYTLSGYVKVGNGATLTIQPGTKIIGDTTQVGSSLWILRGAKIDAQGTATAPIVFTSARSPGNRKPGDWGGIIIIGNGIINRAGTIQTEGGAAGQSENYGGGTDNDDNSGILRYVRIEFAGYDISNGNGQELNSLSSYAVGRGTTYEYLQTMAGLDDSYEYWGGAVDGRYLVSYESGDDHFDWTEGYQGRNQFLVALQSTHLTPQSGAGVFSSDPRGFEGDGCAPDPGSGCTVTNTPVAAGTNAPYSMPVWANFTVIGTGQLAGFPTDGNGAVLRRGTGGTMFNGILARFPGTGLQMRDAFTDSLRLRDSLNITNLILAENGPPGTPTNYDADGADLLATCPGGADVETCRRFAQAGKFASSNHHVGTAAASLITSLDPASLDWTPKVTAGEPDPTTGGSSVVPTHFGARTANFFGAAMPQTSYFGAADPAGPKWWEGWTAYNVN